MEQIDHKPICRGDGKQFMNTNETNKDYRVINNCPRCGGALLNCVNLNKEHVIQCLQCGAAFREYRGKINGNGEHMHVIPLTRRVMENCRS